MADSQLNSDFDTAFNAPPAQEPAQIAPQVAMQAPEPADASTNGVVEDSVNVINPEGKLVSIPKQHVPEALGSGYQMASDEHIHKYEMEQKYGGAGQQLITGLEGAAEASTFGLSTGLERLAHKAGVPSMAPEDIQGRRETNPGTHMLGQAASFFIPGAPEAAALEHVGQAGVEALGMANAASTAAKVGSAAAKASIENMVFQGTDEVSKMLASDPNQSVQTAIADVGLSGLIGAGAGAALGAASPLWKATMGAQTGGILKSLTNKLGGIENVGADAVSTAGEKLGIDISPEIKAALGNDPYAQRAFQTLSDSATNSGEAIREASSTFRAQMGEAVASTLGHTPESAQELAHVSENEVGNSIKESLSRQLKEITEPVTKSYEEISNKFKDTELPMPAKAELGEKIANLIDPGASAESAEAKLVQRVLKEVPGLKNLEQLRNYTSSLGNETNGIAKQELWSIGRKLQGALRDAQNDVLTKSVAADAPHLIDQLASTQAQYRSLKGIIDELNNRLHVGAQAGPKTFIKALNEMDGEAVLRRLSPKGKADIISELAKFPDALDKVRSYHTDQILKASMKDGSINANAALKQIDKLSPEMKSFITPKGSEGKLEAIRELMSRMPEKVGKSGTPQGLDALWQHVPGTAVGAAAMVFGHNPAMAVGMGALTKALGRDMPDAIRLGMLKFLGSDKQIESEGFKNMVEMIHATIKGENLVAKSAKNLFQAGKDVLPESAMPDDKSRERLDKKLKSLQSDPKPLMDVGGKTSHYMPEHGQAMAQTAASVTNYVNSQRPNLDKKSPLDSQPVMSGEQKAKFNRVLDIAQQPLIVLNRIKEGNLSPTDVLHLKNMYPSMYAKLQQKVADEMTNHLDKGEPVAYRTRQGLSLFLGQPLDSTMTPSAIQAAQYQRPTAANPQGTGNLVSSKTGQALSKLPNQYQTQSQARQAARTRPE